MRPRLLDLYSGAGGAAAGYVRAGFCVTGVDHAPQPHYPCTFVQADALEYLRDHGTEYDAIHASPPCQGYSRMRSLPWLRDRQYPLLIEPTRLLLEQIGRPWVLENVMGARLAAGWLCGTMFGLPLYRHRSFLASFLWLSPPHQPHRASVVPGPLLGERAHLGIFTSPHVGHAAGWREYAQAVGIDWMTHDELCQAIPPTYTEFIGHFLRRQLIG